MSEMVERGAAAMEALERDRPASWRALFRAGASAALDPNDQHAVDVCAAVLRESGPLDMSVNNSERCVRVVLNALRGLTALGEQ